MLGKLVCLRGHRRPDQRQANAEEAILFAAFSVLVALSREHLRSLVLRLPQLLWPVRILLATRMEASLEERSRCVSLCEGPQFVDSGLRLSQLSGVAGVAGGW